MIEREANQSTRDDTTPRSTDDLDESKDRKKDVSRGQTTADIGITTNTSNTSQQQHKDDEQQRHHHTIRKKKTAARRVSEE